MMILGMMLLEFMSDKKRNEDNNEEKNEDG